MRVFITGATGYVGEAVALAFARAGHSIRALARPEAAAERLSALALVPRVLHPIVCALGTALLPTALLAQAPHLASTDPDHPIFQSGRPTMVAERLGEGERISVDGRLDEPFWPRATPPTDFIRSRHRRPSA